MKYSVIIIIIISLCAKVFADGIFVPSQKDYPSVYLKNKVTEVNVQINGLIAETTVYQEFENEWNDTVDGVYSFPLPPGARATRLQYSLGDTMVDAVLKIQQQSTTPGTGTGGIISEINKYMGSNVLKIKLNNIPAHAVQGIKLEYISLLNQFNGRYEYHYPLNTKDFIKHPLDYLKIRVQVHSSKDITDYDLLSHPGYHVRKEGTNYLDLEYIKSKAYTATDISFRYMVANSPLSIDLYSWKPDTLDGYFTLIGKPQIEPADSSLSHKVIFLIGNSTTMIGNKINQSKKAMVLALDELSERDSFNIVVFNSEVHKWQSQIMPVTDQNILEAKGYIEEINIQGGNRLDLGIKASLYQLESTGKPSSIIVFNDGKSPVDPEEIEALNTQGTGIYFVAIGHDIDRVRLETIAARNYGFVNYIHEDNILATEMVKVFKKIKNPIVTDVAYYFDNPFAHHVYPEKKPAIFAGSDFLVSGRYKVSGIANINIEGMDYFGKNTMSFEDFFIHNNELSRKIWAKMAIDHLEARILIYGEDDSLKNTLTNLSLDHNIRCRYTAYVQEDNEDNEKYPGDEPGDEEYIGVSSESYGYEKNNSGLINYPNPFHEFTILKLFVEEDEPNKSKFIEIYDINGALLLVIDISDLNSGRHEIVLHTDDLRGYHGKILVAHYRVGNRVKYSCKMVVR